MKRNTKIIILIILIVIISWSLVFSWVYSQLGIDGCGRGSLCDPVITPHPPFPFPETTQEPLTLYASNIELEQGEWEQMGAIILNDQEDEAEYKLTTEIATQDDEETDLVCYIVQSEDMEFEFELGSGLTEDLIIVIQDQGITALGLYICNVELYRDNEAISDTSILIEII